MLIYDIHVQGRQQSLTATTTERVVEGLSTKRSPPPLALYPTGFWQHGRVICSIPFTIYTQRAEPWFSGQNCLQGMFGVGKGGREGERGRGAAVWLALKEA